MVGFHEQDVEEDQEQRLALFDGPGWGTVGIGIPRT